jgi:hypothetical protein
MGSARGSLLLWNHDGTFREVIGGPGEGPGEFAEDFRLQAYSGPDGQTYVNERRRWTVLDSTLAFVRIISAPVVGAFGNDLVVTGDGGYVRTGRSPGTDDSNWFHYFDRDGQLSLSIGPKSAGGLSNEFGRRELVPGADPSTFWAAPPGGAPDGYVLERWSVDGALVQSLERDAPWAKTVQAATAGFSGVPTFQLNRDQQGLLWVTSTVLRDGIDPAEFELSAETTPDEATRLLDLLQHRLEVIDPASGRLLAAAELEIPDEEGNGHPFFPVAGARMGARYVMGEGGFRSFELFEWYLVRP